jgi:hypothetical protein
MIHKFQAAANCTPVLLLISPPSQPTPELLQGFDTATQITALAHWLRHQPSPRSARVRIATDPDHTARAVVLAFAYPQPR